MKGHRRHRHGQEGLAIQPDKVPTQLACKHTAQCHDIRGVVQHEGVVPVVDKAVAPHYVVELEHAIAREGGVAHVVRLELLPVSHQVAYRLSGSLYRPFSQSKCSPSTPHMRQIEDVLDFVLRLDRRFYVFKLERARSGQSKFGTMPLRAEVELPPVQLRSSPCLRWLFQGAVAQHLCDPPLPRQGEVKLIFPLWRSQVSRGLQHDVVKLKHALSRGLPLKRVNANVASIQLRVHPQLAADQQQPVLQLVVVRSVTRPAQIEHEVHLE
mmetsp:Transcript_19070/g.48785  ORF Transcript_19070/g.48785 Transcript_19070/m.48785 type:complete len:268 (-) Transcript_19070:212-1015(-)